MAVRPQHHPFVRRVAEALRQRCGVRGEGARLVVAVSGGADSVALLRALATIAPRRTWRLRLTVGHVQHHLRGQAAEADAAFVAELVQHLDLPLLRADLGRPPRGVNLEGWARQSRYAALLDIARRVQAEAIVTAHQGDDQLETMLMRLLRGASVRGLSGMAWRTRLPPPEGPEGPGRARLLRPMLAVDHEAAVRFLRDLRQPWREDHTNADLTRVRARLRHEVLPALRALRPDVAARAVCTADHLRGVWRLLEGQVSVAAGGVEMTEGLPMLPRAAARALPPVVLAGLLRRLLAESGVPADALGGRALRPLVRASRDRRGGCRRFAFAGQVVAIITAREVRVGASPGSPRPKAPTTSPLGP